MPYHLVRDDSSAARGYIKRRLMWNVYPRRRQYHDDISRYILYGMEDIAPITHNFPLRLPREVYAAVKVKAEQEQRSVNAQIVWLLRRSLIDGERDQARPDRAAEMAN